MNASKKENNSYVIVHASPPSDALTCQNIPSLNMIISNQQYKPLRECLTYRKPDTGISPNISLPYKNVITVVGHTPVMNDKGYIVDESGKLLMIDGGCAFMSDNPESNNIMMKEMATLVNLSEIPGKTKIGLYGDLNTKFMRQGRR